MLRAFLSYHNPLFYPLLLVLALALRLSGGGVILPSAQEGLLWATADCMGQPGHTLYRDCWLAMPPMPAFLYFCLHQIFGEQAWFALRIVGTLMLVASAYWLNEVVYRSRLIVEASLLPGLLLVLMLSTPPFRMEVGSELIALLWLSFTAYTGLIVGQRTRADLPSLFLCGALGGAVALSDLRLLPLAVLVLALTLFGESRHPGKLSGLAGGVLLLTVIGVILLWGTGSLDAFMKQVGSGSWQVWRTTTATHTANDGPLILSTWGGVLLLALAGVWRYRGQAANSTARMRLSESLFASWFAIGLLWMVAELPMIRLSTLWLAAPAIAFYAAAWLLGTRFQRFWQWQFLVVSVLLVLPWVYQSMGGASRFAKRMQVSLWASPAQPYDTASLNSALQTLPTGADLWLLDAQSELYPLLHRTPAIRYVDFRLYREWLDVPLSSPPPEGVPTAAVEALYRDLRARPPAAILCREGYFHRLAVAFPLLGGQYLRRTIGPWQLYLRQDALSNPRLNKSTTSPLYAPPIPVQPLK